MLIPCREISGSIKNILRSRVAELREYGEELKLVTFLVGDSPEQQSFVAIKKRIAAELGISFEFHQVEESVSFDDFCEKVKKSADRQATSGILIQLPLPSHFDREKIFTQIPQEKDIEGHSAASTQLFPLTLSVLTGMKFIMNHEQGIEDYAQAMIESPAEFPEIYDFFKEKSIVVAGRGDTGGGPIAHVLTEMKLHVVQIHSQTPNVENIFQSADIIISATGKKIVRGEYLKKGVILLNVGLRKEEGKLRGDYDEEDVRDIAAYYTATPGGLGPLDVLYLYKNLIDAHTVLVPNI